MLKGLHGYRPLSLWGFLILNFCAGTPIYLKSGTLAIWLADSGISKTKIGFFSLVALPFTFRFLWAPLVDHVPLPFLKNWLGQRRSWIFLSLTFVIMGVGAFALFPPDQYLKVTACVAMGISISAATLWTAVMAYQTSLLPQRQYGPAEGISILGYRLGLLYAGYGALSLVSWSHSWYATYLIMGLTLCLGLLVVVAMPEPTTEEVLPSTNLSAPQAAWAHASWRSHIHNWRQIIMVAPFKDFTAQPFWIICLALMVIYRLDDHIMSTMNNIFFLEMGFLKQDIANAAKFFGMWATILGGLIGGALVSRYGFLNSLITFSIFHGLTQFMYVILLKYNASLYVLYVGNGLEHFSSGMRTTAFLSFQLVLCSRRFAGTQLALLASLASLGHLLIAPFSGYFAEALGWHVFFWIVILATLPGAVLVGVLKFSNWHPRNNPSPLKENSL